MEKNTEKKNITCSFYVPIPPIGKGRFKFSTSKPKFNTAKEILNLLQKVTPANFSFYKSKLMGMLKYLVEFKPFVQTYTPKETSKMMDYIKRYWLVKYKNFKFEKGVPLCITVISCFAPPKSRINTKKKLQEFNDGLMQHIVKPDFDNLDKIVCDALSKIAYHDDCQISHGESRKLYVKPEYEGYLIIIEPQEPDEEFYKFAIDQITIEKELLNGKRSRTNPSTTSR